MIYYASSLLAVLSPGLIGLLFGMTLANLRGAPKSITALSSGIGGMLGYLAVALFIWVQDARGLHAFSPGLTSLLLATLLATASASAFTIFYFLRPRQRQAPVFKLSEPSRTAVKTLIFIVCATLLFTSLYQVAISPVAAWDAFELWVTYADWILRYELHPEGYQGITRASHGPFPFAHDRHPPTIYYIAAFSGFVMEGANAINGWLLPWTFIWVCGALVVWSFVQAVAGSSVLSAIAVYLYCAFPLLENHALLPGYADPWVSILVMTTGALLSLSIHRNSAALLLGGVFFSLLPITLKNTGFIYTAALLLPLPVIMVRRHCSRSFISFIVIGLAALTLLVGSQLVMNGFKIEVAGNTYALTVGEVRRLRINGYTKIVDLLPLTHLAFNWIWALFVNQSFSVILILGMINACRLLQSVDGLIPEARDSLFYLITSSALIFIAFTLPQLMSVEYAAKYASPSSDLGSSRFNISMGALIIMTLAFIPVASHKPGRYSNRPLSESEHD